MASAKSWHPAEPTHGNVETEAAGWVMIVILLGLSVVASFCLWWRVGG